MKTKKYLMFLLMLLASIFILSACNNEEKPSENKTPEATLGGNEEENHVCSFDKEVADKKYLAKEATCGNPNIYYYSCSCGKTGTERFEHGDALDHDFVFSTESKPTCTEDGQKVYQCSMCGSLHHEEGAEKTGHDYEATYNWEDFNCTVTLTCKNNVNHTITKEMSVTSDITKAATCNQEGIKTYTATITYEGMTYTDTKEETIEMADHTFEERLCTVCGAREYSKGLEYELNEDGKSYKVVGIGECTDTNLWIPSTYEGLPVTMIYQYAFANATFITEVVVPNSVEVIQMTSFLGCTSLESMTLPFIGSSKNEYQNEDGGHLFGVIFSNNPYEGSKEIKQYYRPNENLLEKYRTFYIPTSLRNITITGGNVLYGAFYNCDMLENITIESEDVTFIDKYAFYNNKNLKNITLPDTVSYINWGAFLDCSSLTTITLPESLERIERNAFSECTSLEEIIFNDNLKVLNECFNSCTSLTSITLPEGLTTLNGTFTGCTNLTSINFPSTLVNLHGSVFSGCGFEELIIPDTITNFENLTLGGIATLKKLVLPDHATLNRNMFANCTALEYLSIPYIDVFVNAYGNEYSYLGYYFGAQNEAWNDKSVPASLQHLRIASGQIPNKTFNEISIKSLTFGKEITVINDTYLTENYDLENIYFEGSPNEWLNVELPIKEPGFNGKNYYFYDENNEFVLSTDLVLEEGTEEIGNHAFANNISVKNVTLPNSIKTIGDSAFYKCTELENVYYNGTFEEWSRIDFTTNFSNPMYYAKHFYVLENGNYQEITEIVIPEFVTEIKFQYVGMKNVTSITIPETVETIGYYAFAHCELITEITIPSSVTSIGHSALINCFNLEKVTLPYVGSSIKTENDTEQYPLGYIFGRDFNYTDEMNSVRQYFYNTSTTSLSNAYYNLPKNLTKVTITGGNLLYGAFYNCTELKQIVIGDGVEMILPGSFYNCSKLSDLTLPFVGQRKTTATDNNQYPFAYIFQHTQKEQVYSGFTAVSSQYVTEYKTPASAKSELVGYVPNSLKNVVITGGHIGHGAFMKCSNIETIYLKEGVTGIGEFAFRNCSSLLTLVLSNSVTSTEMNTFLNCTSLNMMFFIGTAKEYKNLSYTVGFSGLRNFTPYIYSETEPTDTTYKYWHWNEGKITIWQ